ncbi:MAG: hypothetical protein INR71_03195, partial [Terriglobus roseus]|nr:hypothetical protein [Terriglobus roseus]
YERRPSTPPALTDTSSPDPDPTPSPPPARLEPPSGQPRSLKPKFSSPNLAEQRRLQQLQTEIESQLPLGASAASSPDLDALMSPRATEFTVNPFHGAVGEEDDAERGRLLVPAAQEATKDDPRSPAQVGISPITRSIFDVLR